MLPSALLTGVFVQRSVDQSRSLIENRLVDSVRRDAEALDREFNGTIRVLQTLARSPLLDEPNLGPFWAEARRAVQAQEGWFAVILLAPDGQQLLHTNVPFGEPLRRATDVAGVQQLLETGQPVVGGLRAAPQTGDRRFAIRVPVERGGRIVSVLSAVLEPASLEPLVRARLPETEEWTRTIIDSEHRIVARSRAAERFVGQPLTDTMVARLNEHPAGAFRQASMEGEPLYSTLGYSRYGWTTVVAVRETVLDAPQRATLLTVFSGSTVLLAGGFIGVMLVTRRVSRDFRAARDAAAALAAGRAPDPWRPRLAETHQLQTSLLRAAELLQQHERERDTQLQVAVDAQAHAEEASRAKDHFLAVLGHELRNPLAPATMALELMKRKGDATTERERAVLERQVSHMTRLVDDLLDVSRLTRGKIDLIKRRFEVSAATDRAVDMARPLIRAQSQTLRIDVPREGLVVDADEDRIVQVLINLLSNAAKYSPPGADIALTARPIDGCVELACEDDGPGIASELRDTMFDPFAQGPRTIDRQQGGLGLGLALARTLADLHGGRVTFEPVDPHGSRFIVRLPLAETAAAAARSIDRADDVRIQPRRLLVVEDNSDSREMLQAALEQAGHLVRSAPDAAAALATAATFRPDVAILDIGLPDTDGYTLAQQLRASQPLIGLLALTGYGQMADTEAARRAGFDGHCTKPVTVHMLLTRIAALASPPDGDIIVRGEALG